MKKIKSLVLVMLLVFSFILNYSVIEVYAEKDDKTANPPIPTKKPPVPPATPPTPGSTTGGSSSSSTSTTGTPGSTSGKVIKVKVTEKIPGANCSAADGSTDSKPLYNCSITPGFGSLKGMISEIIKFFTAIAALAGILFIVINGILLSMGSADSGKSSVKGRIVQGVVGLILLLMSGLILNLIAPWIYT